MPNGNENDSRPATLGDINRIYNLLNPMMTTLATINEKIGHYTQPCQEHITLSEKVAEHLKEHRNIRTSVKEAVIHALIDVGKMALVALVVYWLTSKGLI